MAFSLLPKEDGYFTFFIQMGEKIEQAAALLREMLNADKAGWGAFTKKIKDVEHECDEITHQVTTKLNKSFITPFDREDIYTLSVALDDVCDYIDAGARAIVMYDFQEVNEYSRELARVIAELGAEISRAVGKLKSPKDINKHFVEIHRLENEADEIYFNAIAELFKNGNSPMDVIKLKELYEILEYATDRCESVANIIESIVLKHN